MKKLLAAMFVALLVVGVRVVYFFDIIISQ
jgi:hypothetical protein